MVVSSSKVSCEDDIVIRIIRLLFYLLQKQVCCGNGRVKNIRVKFTRSDLEQRTDNETKTERKTLKLTKPVMTKTKYLLWQG